MKNFLSLDCFNDLRFILFRYLTKSLKSSHREVQVSKDEQKNETLDAGNGKKENVQDSQAFRVDAPSDLEMVELLSQYMETSGMSFRYL